MFRIGALLCFVCAGYAVLTSAESDDQVDVTLIHFSDTHARWESTQYEDRWLCSQWEEDNGRCNGGLARMVTFVKDQRRKDPELLLFNGGDDFMGNEWDRNTGIDPPAAFMKLLRPDAMVVGNHEWDKGLNELKRYFDKLDYPVLAANINFREWHGLKDKFSSYVVKHVKGRKICIMGLTTDWVGNNKLWPLEITRLDEALNVGRSTLKSMVEREGCHAKVLLSHLGYGADKWAAEKIPGLDLIVGSHSHSFLWPDPKQAPPFYKPDGGQPQYDKPVEGPYPTWAYCPESGRHVPVVATDWASRYMGKVVLRFKSWKDGGGLSGVTNGKVYLLGGPKSDYPVRQDDEALREIKKWRTF